MTPDENETLPQPLDAIMTEHGIANAELVKASTEQLTFKMVNKGRSGRRITTNIQDKILTALLAVKPDLKLKRKDLFRYEPSAGLVETVKNAVSLIWKRKIKYPQFIDLLVEGGVIGYKVEVGPNTVAFYGIGGEVHIEQGPIVSSDAPGPYDEEAIRSAIANAQKETIDHPAFLKRIHAAGIGIYEVNTRHRKIEYRGIEKSYKEKIPVSVVIVEVSPVSVPVKKAPKKKPAKAKKKKSLTTKARVAMRKRHFKKKKGRGR